MYMSVLYLNDIVFLFYNTGEDLMKSSHFDVF